MATPETTYRLCAACREIYPASSVYCVRDGSPLAEDKRIVAGKFILLRRLGSGAMGTVWEAEQPALERRVALKLLHPHLVPSPPLVERFVREAHALSKLNHPGILPIHEYGQSLGQSYIAMSYLEGKSLRQTLRRQPKPPQPRALGLWLAIARAVAAAHSHGIGHGDLKPENIFLSPPSTGEQVTVLDFGIARLRGGQVGSSPSHDDKDVDERTDVFALGVMLYELLAGRRAFSTKAEGHVGRVAPPLRDIAPELPPRLIAVVEHMMAPRAEDRPALAQAIDIVAARSQEAALLVSPPAPPVLLIRARRAILALMLAAASLMAPVGALLLGARGERPRPS